MVYKNKYTENRNLVETFISLYNSFQIDKMLELFTDDCILQNIGNTSGIAQ